eukprot:6335693-Amphidinium_carterae.1
MAYPRCTKTLTPQAQVAMLFECTQSFHPSQQNNDTAAVCKANAASRIPVGMLCMFGTALSSSAGAVG